MKRLFKKRTVILFTLVACGALFFSQFAVSDVRSPVDQSKSTKANLIGASAALDKFKSSENLRSQVANAAIAALKLAADDENDDEDGPDDDKDKPEGPDRLWDSVMLG